MNTPPGIMLFIGTIGAIALFAVLYFAGVVLPELQHAWGTAYSYEVPFCASNPELCTPLLPTPSSIHP